MVKYRVCTGSFASYQIADSPALAMRQLYMRMKYNGNVPAGMTFRKMCKNWSAEPAHRQPKSLLKGAS